MSKRMRRAAAIIGVSMVALGAGPALAMDADVKFQPPERLPDRYWVSAPEARP